MAKPWGRYEIGYIRHPKFLILTGNATALWWEGKNFCDEHLTDGLIPTEALKMFRFRGAKSLALLTKSCGLKPDGTPYAPLWERQPAGFRMHDYLEHNDTREKVIARQDAANERRMADRQRQAEWRAKNGDRRVTRDGVCDELRDDTRDGNAVCHATVTPPTETPTATTTNTQRKPEGRHAARPATLIPRRRLDAAFEGRRVYVPQRAHADFVANRNHSDAERELQDWYLSVDAEWADGRHAASNPGPDMFRFWKARFEERWPTTQMATDRRMPAWAQQSK